MLSRLSKENCLLSSLCQMSFPHSSSNDLEQFISNLHANFPSLDSGERRALRFVRSQTRATRDQRPSDRRRRRDHWNPNPLNYSLNLSWRSHIISYFKLAYVTSKLSLKLKANPKLPFYSIFNILKYGRCWKVAKRSMKISKYRHIYSFKKSSNMPKNIWFESSILPSFSSSRFC